MTALLSRPARSATRLIGKRSKGLSAVELMISLAISAVLMGGAVPMLKDLRNGQALRATAALLETDIQFARSQAMASGQPLRLSLQSVNGAESCYVIHTGAANACRCEGAGQAHCDAGATLLRLAEQTGASGITLAPVQRSLLFDPGKGTVTPTATLKIQDRDGRAIHQVINIMGRVRSCTPSVGLNGLKPCT
jgi:type IV fimbrial biogenesis protein FimT